MSTVAEIINAVGDNPVSLGTLAVVIVGGLLSTILVKAPWQARFGFAALLLISLMSIVFLTFQIKEKKDELVELNNTISYYEEEQTSCLIFEKFEIIADCDEVLGDNPGDFFWEIQVNNKMQEEVLRQNKVEHHSNSTIKIGKNVPVSGISASEIRIHGFLADDDSAKNRDGQEMPFDFRVWHGANGSYIYPLNFNPNNGGEIACQAKLHYTIKPNVPDSEC